MTPFGKKLREIRESRQMSLKDMAEGLGVSSAYLSAMERGHRGRPSKRFVHRVCQFLGIIWDEAEALQALAERSHPRVVVDTSGLTPAHTELANLLSHKIGALSEDEVRYLITSLEQKA